MRQGREESGQLMIIVALGMVVFLGFAALALDLGQGYSKRRLAQNGADAAALAGMRLVRQQANAVTPLTGAQIYQAIKQVADQNGNAEQLPAIPTSDEAVFLDANKVPLPGGDVYTWMNPDFSGVYGLRVKTRIQYPTLFAGVFGYSQMTSGGMATAMSFGTDLTGLLPVGFKTYAQCSPDFGFNTPLSPPDPDLYDPTTGEWKFFSNDPGVSGGFGWISLDGSNANADTTSEWVVDGFEPGENADPAGYKWWTNYRWHNATPPSSPSYGGWEWDSTTNWYKAGTPQPDPSFATGCSGYYADGSGGSFDWTDPGTWNSPPKPTASWGTPPPPMPGSGEYALKQTAALGAMTGTDATTLLGHPIVWMKNNTGMSLTSAIRNAMLDMVNRDVMILVYNRTAGSGASAKLQIIGFAGFHITRVEFSGSNTEVWGTYTGAVTAGTPTTTPNAGMMTTVRLVAN